MPPPETTAAETKPPKELTPKEQQAAAKKAAEPRYKAGHPMQLGPSSYTPGQPIPNFFGVTGAGKPIPIEDMSNFDECVANKTIIKIDDAVPPEVDLMAAARAKGI